MSQEIPKETPQCPTLERRKGTSSLHGLSGLRGLIGGDPSGSKNGGAGADTGNGVTALGISKLGDTQSQEFQEQGGEDCVTSLVGELADSYILLPE